MKITIEELIGRPAYHFIGNGFGKIIQITLLSLAFGGGIASAQLRDHGPANAALGWPDWYRDLSDPAVALGLCKSQQSSPNPGAAGAPMCFALTPNPVGFAGNIGDEIFYMNLNAKISGPGMTLRYVTGLEAAYGNPPAAGPTRGQEVVFARVRFVMDVTTPECAGTYRIIHPWGDQTFNDVPQGKRSLFYTVDVPIGALLDFDGALNGPVGPFLRAIAFK